MNDKANFKWVITVPVFDERAVVAVIDADTTEEALKIFRKNIGYDLEGGYSIVQVTDAIEVNNEHHWR